jgi:mRNA-degrading endonuclease toxin of MazEF toxin-antitoxin module
MVFFYNINKNIDKYHVPPVNVLGKDRCDYREYGDRPFVVISSDETCLANHTVCIVPLSSVGKDQKHYGHRVYFNYGSETAEVICEQIYTVNTSELIRFDSFLSEGIMDEIDEKVAMNLGFDKPRISTDRASITQIESIIANIIQKEVDKVKSETFNESVDIDNTILKIGEGLSDLFDTKVQEIKEKEEKKEVKERRQTYNKNRSYTNHRSYKGRNLDEVFQRKCDPTIDPISKSNGRIKWTKSLIIEFMHDYETYDYNTLMRKYGCDSKVHLQQMKSRLARKLDKEE